MAMLSTTDLIRRVPLFSQMGEAQVLELADRLVKRRARRGEVLVERGATSQAMHILLTGRARVMAPDGRGREVTLAYLSAGDHLGEMSMIDGQPHSATVIAEVQTDLLSLGRDDFMHFMPPVDSVPHALLRQLVARLRSANLQIEELALVHVYERIARALMGMSELVGETRMIHRRVSRSELARAVGTSREVVSRRLSALEASGLIRTLTNGAMVLNDHLF
jgi:CRP-like cAMP-binding protein